MPAAESTGKKPNIVMIMSDDVGTWNISAYHRGMMGGRTPNLDRIANEGALFTDYYGRQSCTAGRAAFITGQTPWKRRFDAIPRHNMAAAPVEHLSVLTVVLGRPHA